MDCAPKDVVCTKWIWDYKVTLTNSFFLSATEVTQRQYQVLMGVNPSKYQSTLDKKRYWNHPVEQVSWFDAVRFANALSAAQGLPQCYDEDGKVIGERSIYDCKGYRLPTMNGNTLGLVQKGGKMMTSPGLLGTISIPTTRPSQSVRSKQTPSGSTIP